MRGVRLTGLLTVIGVLVASLALVPGAQALGLSITALSAAPAPLVSSQA
jgi:hypothetical protein